MRAAGREDLYALQGSDPFDLRVPPEVLHKNCGGRISYQPGAVLDWDRYVCNGVTKTFGPCGWAYRCGAVHAWSDAQIAAALYVVEKADERVYKLELTVGKRGEHDSTTCYRLRPATADERQSYMRGAADTWKLT